MRRLATFFILLCFSATFLSNSMFMLSIEGRQVYTEDFSISHIMQAEFSSLPTSGFGSCRYLSHRHILLAKYVIPEEKVVPAVPVLLDADKEFLPNSLVISSSSEAGSLLRRINFTSRLKFPIPPLLRSSVLLI